MDKSQFDSAPMLAIAAAIRCDSKGPALFTQTRIGKNGVPFRVLKFRSMRVEDEDTFARRNVTANDPRVTAIGRLIRKKRCDNHWQ